MNKAFKGATNLGEKVWFNEDCCLHGRWGDRSDVEYNVHTMAMQASIWGIPSIQFEIPRTLRKTIAKSPELIKKMAQAIVTTYDEVIVANWEKRRYSSVGPIDRTLAS